MKTLLLWLLPICMMAAPSDMPFQIIETGSYRDGGTVFVKLQGPEDKQVIICIDGRRESSTYLELFIGADYPKDKGAKLAPESTRQKLVAVLTDLTALEPQKYSAIIDILKRHVEMKSRTSASSQPLTAPDFCGNFRTDYASRAVILHASRPAVSGG